MVVHIDLDNDNTLGCTSSYQSSHFVFGWCVVILKLSLVHTSYIDVVESLGGTINSHVTKAGNLIYCRHDVVRWYKNYSCKRLIRKFALISSLLEAIEWLSLLQQEPYLESYVAFAEAENYQARLQ